MSVTPDELRAALKYSVTHDRTITQHARTLAAAYREAVEALREARDELAYMYANYHEHVRQADKDGDAETIARLNTVLAKAKEAGVE